jgi:ATP-dependent helicase HrpA
MPRDRPLLAAVAAVIPGADVAAEDFDLARVPIHLLPRYRVLAADGRELGVGRDLADLQHRFAADHAELVQEAADLTATGATSWTFGTVPAHVQRRVSGVLVTGWPALVDRGRHVDLVVLTDEAEAVRAHRRGVRRLLALAVRDPGPRVYAALPTADRLVLGRYPGGADAVLADTLDACIDAALAQAPRDAAQYDAALAQVQAALPGACAAALPRVVACLAMAWQADRGLTGLASPVVAQSAADVRAELDRLVGPRFVSRYGAARLPDLRRYLQALAWRVGRIPDDPAGDWPPPCRAGRSPSPRGRRPMPRRPGGLPTSSGWACSPSTCARRCRCPPAGSRSSRRGSPPELSTRPDGSSPATTRRWSSCTRPGSSPTT